MSMISFHTEAVTLITVCLTAWWLVTVVKRSTCHLIIHRTASQSKAGDLFSALSVCLSEASIKIHFALYAEAFIQHGVSGKAVRTFGGRACSKCSFAQVEGRTDTRFLVASFLTGEPCRELCLTSTEHYGWLHPNLSH